MGVGDLLEAVELLEQAGESQIGRRRKIARLALGCWLEDDLRRRLEALVR